MLIKLLFASIFIYVSWTLICLELNYRRAKRMNIPLIRIPIDFLNVPWQVIESHIWPITDFLRVPLPRCCRYMRRGWHFVDKARTHEELGPVYAFVTPKIVLVQLCEPEAVTQVFGRRLDFPRPGINYELLAVYGPSISTASPEDWARHRKVLATPFMNESIMRSVWDESIRQTRQMLSVWTRQGISSVARDTRTVSLNVLAAIGFRRPFDFKTLNKEPSEMNGKFSYRDALQIVLDNAILCMLIPRRHLRYPWLPLWMQRIGKAADDFAIHMRELLEDELAALNRGEKSSGGLLPSLVRGLDAHQKDKTKGVSAEEIFGNLFVINFAGHDTTANTLAYAMLLLTTFPEVQEWVGGELREVIKDLEEGDWDYSTLFPKLVRCRAVMLETLRLYPPIMSLPKWTNEYPQNIKISDREITIPSQTFMMSNVLAVHTHPKFWPNPLEWKPSRWIVSNGSTESVFTPPRETYFPWSDGPQNCPGLKFSQVEFVAVLSCLLREHRVKAVSEGKESAEEVSKRVKGVIDDYDATMLLKMRDPDRVKVRCDLAG